VRAVGARRVPYAVQARARWTAPRRYRCTPPSTLAPLFECFRNVTVDRYSCYTCSSSAITD
jgi:hypothetical protein